ncbi:hypothetical protein [Streptomyces sp. NBC_01089]|uniref:hypothetical protein n=1 Tax=Streptomyces sp. NBC_01089 TaxID=2903747 RepID=UPI0038638190|nr:hypothetical protein OG510_02440 [Streptomyces sp. NBC_01089]
MLRRIVTVLAAGAMLAGFGLAASGTAQAGEGGYWATQCDYGRACLHLSGLRQGPGGAYWNMIGCGRHPINDYYDAGLAHGNTFIVTYLDNRWDRVDAWTGRGLDASNLVTEVFIPC